MIDFNACLPFPVQTTRRRDAILSDSSSGFIAARQIYERPLEVIDVSWSQASEGDAAVLFGLWVETQGGILPMTFTHPDGSGVLEVAFAGRPTFEATKLGARTFNLSAQLEVVL